MGVLPTIQAVPTMRIGIVQRVSARPAQDIRTHYQADLRNPIPSLCELTTRIPAGSFDISPASSSFRYVLVPLTMNFFPGGLRNTFFAHC